MSKRRKDRIAESNVEYIENSIEIPFWMMEKESRASKREIDAQKRKERRAWK